VCNYGKELEEELRELCLKNQEHPEGAWPSPNEMQRATYLREEIMYYNEHKEKAQLQREAHNRHRLSLGQGEAMLVCDFKENLKLNQSRVQVSCSYYEQPARTLFEAVLHFRDADGNIQTRYFDIISECLDHDAPFVIKALKLVFEHEEFRARGFKKCIIWMDGARHFRNLELLRFLVDKSSSMEFEVNYFAPYHGKSVCDARFSLISRYLQQKLMEKDGQLLSTGDVIKAIQDGQNRARANNPKAPPVVSYQILAGAPEEEKPATKEIYHFDGITSLYSYRIRSGNLYASRWWSPNASEYLLVRAKPRTITRSLKNKEPKVGYSDITDPTEKRKRAFQACKQTLTGQKMVFKETTVEGRTFSMVGAPLDPSSDEAGGDAPSEREASVGVGVVADCNENQGVMALSASESGQTAAAQKVAVVAQRNRVRRAPSNPIPQRCGKGEGRDASTISSNPIPQRCGKGEERKIHSQYARPCSNSHLMSTRSKTGSLLGGVAGGSIMALEVALPETSANDIAQAPGYSLQSAITQISVDDLADGDSPSASEEEGEGG